MLGFGPTSSAPISALPLSDSAITGTCTVTFAVPAISATGEETFTGTATETFAVPSIAATGEETFSGTATETFAVPLIEATGEETFSGTATETFAVPSITATGEETLSGSLSETFAVPSIDASGAETFTGEVSETFIAPAIAATGEETFADDISETFSAPSIAATGSQEITGTASVEFGFAVSLTGRIPAKAGVAYGDPHPQWSTKRPRTIHYKGKLWANRYGLKAHTALTPAPFVPVDISRFLGSTYAFQPAPLYSFFAEGTLSANLEVSSPHYLQENWEDDLALALNIPPAFFDDLVAALRDD